MNFWDRSKEFLVTQVCSWLSMSRVLWLTRMLWFVYFSRRFWVVYIWFVQILKSWNYFWKVFYPTSKAFYPPSLTFVSCWRRKCSTSPRTEIWYFNPQIILMLLTFQSGMCGSRVKNFWKGGKKLFQNLYRTLINLWKSIQ